MRCIGSVFITGAESKMFHCRLLSSLGMEAESKEMSQLLVCCRDENRTKDCIRRIRGRDEDKKLAYLLVWQE